jgi:hypothetical protein
MSYGDCVQGLRDCKRRCAAKYGTDSPFFPECVVEECLPEFEGCVDQLFTLEPLDPRRQPPVVQPTTQTFDLSGLAMQGINTSLLDEADRFLLEVMQRMDYIKDLIENYVPPPTRCPPGTIPTPEGNCIPLEQGGYVGF